MNATVEIKLPDAQARLYRCLAGKGDVPFKDIFDVLFQPKPGADQRYMQQRIGAYVSKANRRLRAYRQVIRPGDVKGTYRLSVLP